MRFHDYFAGIGGSSKGLSAAGLQGIVALNHWDYAIELHNANHPTMDHDKADIWQANPSRYRPAEVGWFSPECRAHSQASGKTRYGDYYLTDLWRNPTTDPADDRSRMLMESVPHISAITGYKYVMVENVTEVVKWIHFNRWLKEMEKLDYSWKLLFLNSQFFGTPQSRDRFFAVFWKRGMPAPDLDFKPLARCPHCAQDVEAIQAWKPNRWHGRYGRQYTYICPHCTKEVKPFVSGAQKIIDWNLPITRIGDRPAGLSPLTIKKIEYGLNRYASDAMVVDTAYSQTDSKVRPVDEPLFTQTTQQSLALTISYYGRENAVRSTQEPLPTVPTENKIGLVMAYNGQPSFAPTDKPMPTVTTVERHSLIMANYGNPVFTSLDQPMSTVPTVTKHNLILSGVNMDDVLFRMLRPRELASGTGFPDSYILNGSQKNQTKGIGGAVDPNIAAWLGSRVMQAAAS